MNDLHAALREEEERFAREHPRSRELFERAKGSLLGGVRGGGFPHLPVGGVPHWNRARAERVCSHAALMKWLPKVSHEAPAPRHQPARATA